MKASSDLEEKWFFWLSVQHLLSELIQSVLKGAAEIVPFESTKTIRLH